MASLYFKINADWEKVVRLRNEIEKLETKLKSFGSNMPNHEIKETETQLCSAKQEFTRLTTEAAKAGMEIEGGFKKKIYDASQVVNKLTSAIIQQKNVVKEVEADVKRLGESYRQALKNNPLAASSRLAEYQSAKKALDEEKAALFGLTQQQAEARLSVKSLRDEYALLKESSKESNDDIGALTDKMKDWATKIAKSAAAMGVAFSAKEFVQQVAKVRGEFQQLEVAFETMLGNKAKANALMSQLVETAAITPFGLQDVTNGAKQLLAYGLESEKINETLTRLGDIAAGLSIPLNDLTYLYGTTMVQGRMYTQDLNQFLGRGIPLTEELAKQFSTTSDKVKDLVTEGKVGFPEVEKAIISLTSEGGKFGGLMEAQSKTISGQIGNIEDAIESMFNEIGKRSEGIINTGLSVTSALVENWQKVGEAIGVAITAYGSYKAVLMSVTAYQKAHVAVLQAAVVEKKLAAAAGITLSDAEAIAAAKTKFLTLAQKELITTMKRFAAATIANPYVLAAAAITGLVYVMYKLTTSETAAERATRKYNEAKKETIEKEKQNKEAIDALISTAEDEAASTGVRHDALMQLEKYYPNIFAKYQTEYDILKNIAKIKKEIADEDAKNSITNLDNELTQVNKRWNELDAKSKKGKHNQMSNMQVASAMSNKQLDMTGNGLTAAEVGEMEALEKRRNEIIKEQKKQRVDSYFADLTGISNEELQAQISKRKTLVADLRHQGKTWGNVTGEKNTGLNGAFRTDDIQAQLQALEREQNARNAKKGSSAEWVTAAKKEYDTALKAYNDYVSQKGNNVTQQEFEKTSADLKTKMEAAKKKWDESKVSGNTNLKKEQAEYNELLEQNAQERIRKAQDLQNQVDQANISTMKESSEKAIAQMELDFEKQMQELDRQKEDYLKAKKDAAKKEFESNPANKGKTFNGSGVELSDEENRQFDALYNAQIDAYEKAKAKIGLEEIQALHEYLKEYGTYQEQKYAIAQEYAEKIKKAQTETERKTLEKQRDTALAGVESKAINANIDWELVFGDFGQMFGDIVKPEMEKVRAYTKTNEFNNADDSSKQTIIEALTKMEDSFGDSGSLNFRQLGKDIQTYRDSLKLLEEAQWNESDALEQLQMAQDNYKKALESGSETQKSEAKKALENAKTNAEAASANAKAQQDAVNANKEAVTSTAKGLSKGMQGVLDNISLLASSSIKDKITGFVGLMSKAPGKLGVSIEKVSDRLKSVPIVGWILSIIDMLKDGLSDLVTALIDAVLNAVANIISDVLSGDLVMNIVNSLAEGLSKVGANLVNGLSFGLINLHGANYDDLNELKEKYEALSEVWDELIEKKEEYIDIKYGSEALQASSEAAALLAQKSGYARNLAREAAGAGASTGSHSIAARQNKALKAYKSQLDSITGTSGLSLTDSLLNATPEQLSKIKDEMYEMWMNLDDTFRGALEDIIECNEKAEELKEKMSEAVTGVSFDSFYDSFSSMLTDLDSKNKDFAENFEEYMRNAVLQSLLADKYKDQLDALYKQWSSYAGDSDKLTPAEAQSIKEQYNEVVSNILSDRDELLKKFGFSTTSTESQSASTKSFESMSQDTANELNGRFTALQESNENINMSITELKGTIKELLSTNGEQVSISNEILTILAQSYLEIQQIRENTGEIVKPIKNISTRIDSISRKIENL